MANTNDCALFAALQLIAERSYGDSTGPWALTETQALATDGHIALVVPRHALGELPQPPSNIAAKVSEWLTLSAESQLLSRDSLRAFAEVDIACTRCAGARRVTCDECDGMVTHDCECRTCGDCHTVTCECGDGKMRCPVCRSSRVGVLLGKKVNTRLLADILRIVGDERDILGAVINLKPTTKQPSAANECLVFRPIGGEDWTAFLMPMVDDTPSVWAYKDAR